MKISDYVPKLYKNNIEMNNIIYSEEQDFEKILKPYIEKAFNDNMIKTATEDGIANYEKVLYISLDDNKDNLEYRKAKVIAKLTTTVPLTYRWLENNISSLVGKENFTMTVNYNQYSLIISVANVYKDTAEILYEVYRPLIPANMTLTTNIYEDESTTIYTGGIVQDAETVLYKMAESEVK